MPSETLEGPGTGATSPSTLSMPPQITSPRALRTSTAYWLAEDDEEAKKALAQLQGTWLVASSQIGDEKEPAASTTKKRVVVKGDKFTLESATSGTRNARESLISRRFRR